MMLSLIESLRRLVRQDLNRLETPVGNFHGSVAGTLDLLEESVSQSWLKMTTTGTALLSLEEFYQQFSTSELNRATLEVATLGQAEITTSVGQVTLLRTLVTSTQLQTIRCELSVEGAGSQVGVYLDGVLMRTVQGTAAVPLTLSPGTHSLSLVTQAPKVTVSLPRNFAFSGTEERLEAPQWRQVTTGYLDAQNGAIANNLEWVTTPEAGGYRVLRRRVEYLANLTVANDGRILAVGDLAADNTYVLSLENDQTALLLPGSPILSQEKLLGYVVRAQLDSAGDTEIVLRLPAEATAPTEELLNAVTYTGTLIELVRIPASPAQVMTYTDTAVTAGDTYEYALQAYGRLDASSYSELSALEQVRAGDFAAPASITIIGTPSVLDRRVTVRFTTPSDSDYQGVRVYWRNDVSNSGNPFTVQSIAGNVVTVQAGTVPDITGYKVQFAGSGTEYTVSSRTSTTFTLSTTPAAQTVGTQIAIWKQDLVMTDYGSPSSDDELSFNATKYGKYFFASFDRSGNEQAYGTTVEWTYATAADTFSGPPVLAIRQLSDAEQANFAGYTDTITYAVVEVFAYDPQQPVATRTNGVTLYYQKEGEVVRDLTPVTGTFPTTIAGAQTIDNPPSGTRTRYIAINRSAPTLRVWATNSLNLQSDITTYVADHDTIPKVTSLETQVNPAEDTVTFTVVVDDDTACVEWSVDGGAATLLNTSVNKRVSNNPLVNPITLRLGQLKTLTVVPYAVDVTGMTTLQKAAEAGPAVSRELVRTPRSFVQVENKDANGVRSVEWATLTFSMSPAPEALVTGRTGTVSVVSGETRITDGTATWTTDQYKSGLTAAFYARVTAAGRAPELRRIVANTGTVLSLEGQLSVTSGAVSFEIWNGAVLVRKVPGSSVFLPTTGTVTEARSADFTYEFYAHINGSYRESTRSITVDADDLPQLTNFRYDYNSTSKVLTVRFDSADDDSTYWEVYERKGGWPNSTSATPGTAPTSVTELLPQYLRFSGGVERPSYARSLDGVDSGIWYAVAVPKNSFGEPGILSTASINLGTYTPPKQLTELTLSPTLSTQNLNIAVTSQNTISTDPVNFTIQRLDNPASLTTLSRTISQLPFNFDVGETIVALGTTPGNTRDWQVTAVLNVVGGNTITRTARFRTQTPTNTVTLNAVSASVTDIGSCDTFCYSFGSSPHRRQVLWQVLVNGQPTTAASPYYVDIEVAADAAGTSYSPLVYGLPAYLGSYLDETNCIYEVVSGGTSAYWKYRITVVDANQQVLSPSVTATTSQIVRSIAYCQGNPI